MSKLTKSTTTKAQTATPAAQPSAALKALLDHQAAVAQAEQELQRLQALKTSHEERIASAEQLNKQMAAMGREQEDLLADVAAGEDKQQALAALRERMAAASDQLGDTEFDVSDAVLAGLGRKTERAQAELKALQAKRPALLRAMLMDEAEMLGAQYAVAALKTKDLFHRLCALNEMLLAHGRSISLTTGANLELPLFELESVRPHADFHLRGHIVRGPFFRVDVMGYAVAERERIVGLGVDLAPDAS